MNPMQKVLTAAQMREVDRLTTERYGIPSIILMENAAHAVARVITEKLSGSVKGKSILILCGKGNNGGDGAALARVLGLMEASVEVVLLGKVSETKGDARVNFSALSNSDDQAGVAVFVSDFARLIETESQEEWEDLYDIQTEPPDVVVDAIFGTGLSRPLEIWVGNIIHKLNFAKGNPLGNGLYVSIDIPSGLHADSGASFGEAFEADFTVTFTAPKPGNILPGSAFFNGELFIEEIGSPRHLAEDQTSALHLAGRYDLAEWLEQTRFSHDSYKNKRGHALVIAGSETYSGAAVLAGNSAIRSGVGLVTLACPSDAKTEIASRILPEVILATLGSPEFDELAPKANAIAVGPGLSATDPEIESLVRKVVEERTTPVIVDAGALWFCNPPNCLFQKPARSKGMPPLILTPHEGEFLRLLGEKENHPVGEAPPLLRKEGSPIKDRVAAVREFSQANNVILVLKGERVLIGNPDGRVVVNPTGNSGLGKAGNGDTLTGVLAGFCAQAAAMDIDIFETVVAAVYIAGLAGDIAEKKYGKRVMTASDVRECLADAFAQCEVEN
jgi:hydroxyethylthiazole kinase-like uncharacterized protein yjeF